MKILAIDTSSKVCSVSILEDNNLIIEKHNNDEKTHSQKLMPLIDEIFKCTNLALNDIGLLACCIGPGSFTGIRIGVSTIKAFADAKNIPVVGITSLESLAYNISEANLIASIIDAKNNNVYFSLYDFDGNFYSLIEQPVADNIDSIIGILKKYSRKVVLVGDGAINHFDLIKEQIGNAILADDNLHFQTSISVAKCALTKYHQGLYGDSDSLSPIYLKKSQAERALDGEK